MGVYLHWCPSLPGAVQGHSMTPGCEGSLCLMLALLAGTLYMASAIVWKQLTAISKVTCEVAMKEDA